jgi:alpha-1,6-mannosyltransferase
MTTTPTLPLDLPRRASADGSRSTTPRWALPALLAVGLALELVWIRFYLRPFSLVRLEGPQIMSEPFVPVLGPDTRGLGSFLLSVFLLFGLYFLALALVRFVPGRRLLPVSVGFGALFALTLWPTIALGSTDLYHYILDGRALALHGGNPLATPPQDFWNDRLAYILFFNTENTGAYGPLFYTLAAGAALLGHDDLVWSTVAVKGLAMIWLGGCLPLVYLIAERVRRGRGAAALLLFAWNPLVLFEVAGSGHNDIGVAFFGLLAVWLAVSGRWRWAPAALALGVLVKPTALLLLPALAVWLWFRPERPPLRQLAVAFGAAAAIVVVAYLPFWAGSQTFSQIRHLATLRMNSPADLAVVFLEQRMDSGQAVRVVKLLAGGAFLLAAGLVLARARGPRPAALVGATFWCLFAYLMLASWWFWPWYLVPLIAFGAVLWPGRAATVAVVFSMTSMLLYAALGWRETLFTYQTAASQSFGVAAVVFLAPALVWASGWWNVQSTEPES